MIERALNTSGRPFVIQRGEDQIGEATGLKDGRSRTILFLPGVDIVVGDWLEDKEGQTRLFVSDVDHVRSLRGVLRTSRSYMRPGSSTSARRPPHR
jgi:hypothetical protein